MVIFSRFPYAVDFAITQCLPLASHYGYSPPLFGNGEEFVGYAYSGHALTIGKVNHKDRQSRARRNAGSTAGAFIRIQYWNACNMILYRNGTGRARFLTRVAGNMLNAFDNCTRALF